MSNPSQDSPDGKETRRRPAYAYWAYDDEDEDEADYDDDEDEGIDPPQEGRWSWHPDFGSPERWSRQRNRGTVP
jgi:hypothetical protein